MKAQPSLYHPHAVPSWPQTEQKLSANGMQPSRLGLTPQSRPLQQRHPSMPASKRLSDFHCTARGNLNVSSTPSSAGSPSLCPCCFVCLCRLACVPACLPAFMSVCLPVCLCLSACLWPVCLLACLSDCLSVCLSGCLASWLTAFMSVCLRGNSVQPVCLPICVPSSLPAPPPPHTHLQQRPPHLSPLAGRLPKSRVGSDPAGPVGPPAT